MVDFYEWRKVGRRSASTELAIDRWLAALEACTRSDQYERRVRSGEPGVEIQAYRSVGDDLLRCVAEYGLTEFILSDMSDCPIILTKSERAEWDADYMPLSMLEMQILHSEDAGAFLLLVATKRRAFTQAISSAADERIETLAKARVTDPRSLSFTDWDALAAEGVEFDEEPEHQVDSVLRPITAYEELVCFARGLEVLRALSVTEQNPELNLPDKETHDSLSTIDLNHVYRVLDETAPHLRTLKLALEKLNPMVRSALVDEVAPDEFWWRHKSLQGGRQRGRQRRGSANG